MNEKFLQFIWKHKLFNINNLQTTSNEKIEILELGEQNFNAGADFLNAKIKINEVEWCGNVEIHQNSSNWYTHKHEINPSYDNVILHVVYNHDVVVRNSKNQIIPTLILQFNENLYKNYENLLKNEKIIPCQSEISKINKFFLLQFSKKLLTERLMKKSKNILEILEKNYFHWEDACYQLLARNFGFKTNSETFVRLANSLPLNVILKHKNNLFQIEALLFGQAGMLSQLIDNDDYFSHLQQEYKFLQHKYNLKPVEFFEWKFLRLRPANFPTIRIAQFASLLHYSHFLFSNFLNIKEINDLFNLFSTEISEYWKTHYQFGKISKSKNKNLGKDAYNSSIINTLSPILYTYGKVKDDEYFVEKSYQILEKIEAEDNFITKDWEKVGIILRNAFESQAFLELKNEYCTQKRCLDCEIGKEILTKI